MTAFELRAHDWFEGGAPKELAVTNTLLTISPASSEAALRHPARRAPSAGRPHFM